MEKKEKEKMAEQFSFFSVPVSVSRRENKRTHDSFFLPLTRALERCGNSVKKVSFGFNGKNCSGNHLCVKREEEKGTAG